MPVLWGRGAPYGASRLQLVRASLYKLWCKRSVCEDRKRRGQANHARTAEQSGRTLEYARCRNGCYLVTKRRKVRGSNPQGLIQPRRFSRALPSPIGLTFRALGCGNDSRKLRKPPEISFAKQGCKARCTGFQVLGESAGNQGEAGFSFPQLGRFCALASLQPRCVVVGLRKRFYANGFD